jgi:hypothetical protein
LSKLCFCDVTIWNQNIIIFKILRIYIVKEIIIQKKRFLIYS